MLDQPFRDFELIIVDDGSADDIAAVVGGFSDDRLVYLRTDHRGASSARNEGVRSAQGRYLVFLDSDDRALPTWLDSFASAISSGEPGLVLCGMECIGPDEVVRWRWQPGSGVPDVGEVIVHFEAGQVAIRRDLFVQSGGFTPALAFGENTELAIRLLCQMTPGPQVGVVRDVLVQVRPAGATQDYSASRIASARYVLAHHRAWRRQFPHLWASYHAIAGADLARRGSMGPARRQFASALASDPQGRHLARLAAATVPLVARVVWPVVGNGAAGSAEGAPGDAPPAVLFVALASGLGGSMRSLATLLSHLGGTRRVVVCPAPTTFTELIDHLGVFEERLVVPGEGPARLVSRMGALLVLTGYVSRNRHRFVAIHANGLAERNLVALAARVSGKPVVVWVHDWTVSDWSRRLAPFLDLLTPETRYAAVSDEAKSMLVETGIATAGRVTVVPNPIDPSEVRSSLRAPRARVAVGYLGTPAHYKGFHLLPALIEALEGEPITWLLYAGPFGAMPEVWDELRILSQRNEIEMPGKVIDVGTAYAACDIVVCPSLNESFGRVVAEAMANGLPVVATDLPPLRALIGDDEAGVLVPPGDVAAAAAAIRLLATNPALRESRGRAGLARVRRYEPGPVAAQMERLYGLPATSR